MKKFRVKPTIDGFHVYDSMVLKRNPYHFVCFCNRVEDANLICELMNQGLPNGGVL